MIKDEIENILPSSLPVYEKLDSAIVNQRKGANNMLEMCISSLLTAHAEGKIILITEDMVERLARYLYCSENSPKAFEKYIKEAQSILTFLKGAK